MPDNPSAAGRLESLDAFRGAILLLMASGGLGLAEIARHFPDNRLWQVLGEQTEHAVWQGATFWDLIQPAFMFMVGISLPWSVAGRKARGAGFPTLLGHALRRSLVLILLAVFLNSAWSRQTEWGFTNVLAQIGLGYPFLFLLAFSGPRTPWVVAAVILTGYWLAFALAPLPPAGFDWLSAGLPEDWNRLGGFAAHWEKNVNCAAAFDRWWLNLFPRAAPYTHNSGGYQTLNFIPSLVTMIFGLLAGRWLREDRPVRSTLQGLVIAGVAGIGLGWALSALGVCPLVKRIWTPSWTLFSAGGVTLMLAFFVAVIDVRGSRRWAFPFMVAGLNPITLYLLWQLGSGFIRQQVKIHFGQDFFETLGSLWSPLLERGTVLLVLWLVVYWMYRRRIFLRI